MKKGDKIYVAIDESLYPQYEYVLMSTFEIVKVNKNDIIIDALIPIINKETDLVELTNVLLMEDYYISWIDVWNPPAGYIRGKLSQK